MSFFLDLQGEFLYSMSVLQSVEMSPEIGGSNNEIICSGRVKAPSYLKVTLNMRQQPLLI